VTTVVYRDGVLASDSKMTNGADLFIGVAQKVMRKKIYHRRSFVDKLLSRGADYEEVLIGFAGDVSHVYTYIDALFETGAVTFNELDASLIVVHEDGKVVTYIGGDMYGIPMKDEYCAIGSGSSVALGALFFGASAQEAVEAAIHFDNMSGGDIQSVSFDEDE